MFVDGYQDEAATRVGATREPRGLTLGRREFLGLATGAASLVVAGCATTKSTIAGSVAGRSVGPQDPTVSAAELRRRSSNAVVRSFALTAAPFEFDLAGRVVNTWAFSSRIPGPLVRVNRGDVVRLKLTSTVRDDTAIHWHGIALRNDMDGVPGVTQRAVRNGETFDYEFAVPDAGTYFFHPHVGTQLDRGLYAPIIVDDPSERGDYDREWIVVLDDWIDGIDGTPDDELQRLRKGMNNMTSGGHDMSSMPRAGATSTTLAMRSDLLGGDAGDVRYPYYLLNGRPITDPETFAAKPGDRVRLRVINAASDTAFVVALAGHTMDVTHTDGLSVTAKEAASVLIGMGERFDAIVTVNSGAFALVAEAEGKASGYAFAIMRSSTTAAVPMRAAPGRANILQLNSLASPIPQTTREIDRTLRVVLGGSMSDYRWTINGKTFGAGQPLPVRTGERVRLIFENQSAMWHPMHLHGHSFTVPAGARKDTVIVKPQEKIAVEFDADNPGQWMVHCHNVYHQEAGMLTTLSYRA